MKKVIALISFLFFADIIFCQEMHQAESFQLNSPVTGDQIYEASQYIKLLEPGFHYVPQANESFTARINPFLVFPPTGGETGGPNPGDDGVVGAINGAFNVSPSGAATYTLPIDLPPGMAGLMPQLSLNYNSQGGNGPLGIGWGLAGISSITRINSSEFYDGFIKGVDLNMDALSIDGKRLIADPNNADIYYTDIFDGSKIIHHYNPLCNDYGWFELKTKDGLTVEYGNTTDSRIEARQANPSPYSVAPAIQWNINKIIDMKENFIEFKYNESNNNDASGVTFSISEILYTGNSKENILPSNKISFTYISNETGDKELILIHNDNENVGTTLWNKNLLKKITIKSCEKLYKEYELEYYRNAARPDFYTHLTEVHVTGIDGAKLNPLKFTYGEEGVLSEEFPLNDVIGDYDLLYFGDFNGDGRTDIISYINKKYSNDELHYFFSSSDGSTLTPVGMEYIHHQFSSILVSDMDGDGLDDFILVWVKGNHNLSLDFYRSTGTTFASPLSITGLTDLHNPSFSMGDYNGDGKVDLFITSVNQQEQLAFYELFVTDINQCFASEIGSIHEVQTTQGELISADFNGDGKSEIMIFHDDTQCSIFEVSGFPIYNGGYPTKDHKVYVGDFNGDGKADILTGKGYFGLWELNYFDGRVFHQGAAPLFSLPVDPVLNPTLFGCLDFNGDGKKDFYEIIPPLQGQNYKLAKLYIFNGNGYKSHEFILGEDVNQLGPSEYQKFIDFNGDGNEDLIQFAHPASIFFVWPNNKERLISTISNSLNLQVKVEFKALTDNLVYTKGTGATYPLRDISPALYVVKQFFTENTIGSFNSTTYNYNGAKVHLQGKGFLGFRQINVIDNERHIETDSYNSIFPDYYFSYPEFAITKTQSGAMFSRYRNNYQVKDYGKKGILPYAATNITNDLDFNYQAIRSIKTSITFAADDNYGNIQSIKTLTDEDGALSLTSPDADFRFSTLTEFTYEPADETNWINSRVKSKTIKSNAPYPGCNEISRTTNYEYYLLGDVEYPDDYPLLRKTINYSGENLLEEEYWYDGVGNIIKTKISAPNSTDPDITDRETHFEYSDTYSKRFLTKTYTVLSAVLTLSKETSYYPENGLPKESFDANGLKTSYFYDSFNRLQKKINPDGVNEISALRWKTSETGMPDGTLFYSWDCKSGVSAVLTCYDKFGREVGVISKAFDNTAVLHEKAYDNLGRLEYIYEPNDKTKYTKNKFNTYGQLIEVKFPDLTSETYSYSGRTTTATKVTNAISQTQTKKANALGWIEESIDAKAQSVKYEYYSDGQIHNTYLVGVTGSNIENTYDPVTGKPLTISDPDAGIIEYTYNPYGELVKQKQVQSATKTVEYTFKFDKLGRNIEKTNIEEGTTLTSYDTKTNGKGLVAKVENTTLGHSIEYEYDALSRVSEMKEKIDAKIYVSNMGYDVFGRMNKSDYPYEYGTQPVLSVSQQYDNNGFLVGITNVTDQKTLWQLTEMNIKGQIKKYTLGNGLETQQEYYAPTGLPFTTKTFNSTTRIQDLEYDWYETGNLKSRKKWLNQAHSLSLYEEFTYDELNRLDITKLNTLQTSDINYEPSGNIESKTGLGLYTYAENGAGIHAVTSVENTTGLINTESQNITYTPFNKVNHISQGSNKMLDLWYGLDQQRIKQTTVINGVAITKIYIGGMLERVNGPSGNTDYYFISTPAGICAVYVKAGGAIANTLYIHTDYLGSINCLTNEAGELVQEYSFDAWGNRRDPATWQPTTATMPALFCDRGFTGHEHWEAFGLINMNGRVYDPITARFLSPDIYVSDPVSSQALNRFSYCMNNPLIYTDPDGNFPWLIAGLMLAGGYLGGVGANQGELNPLQWDYNSPMTYIGIGFGAMMGCLGGYGLVNPGTVNLCMGIITPAGGIYLVGQGSDWQMQWNTVAGGYGERTLNKKADFSFKRLIFNYGNEDSFYGAGFNTLDPVSQVLLSSALSLSTYVGDYYGAPVYESEGFKNNRSGITLPPVGIFVGTGVYDDAHWINVPVASYNDMLLRHEYGHWIQWEIVGTYIYYSEIGRASFNWANDGTIKTTRKYCQFWTEKWANTLSYFFHGQPSDWDFYNWPIDDKYGF